MRKNPQILHIGFSKCASTYLRALFRGHSQVHLAFKTGFFTPFLATDMTFDQYQAFFVADDNVVNVESDEHLTLPGIHPVLGVRTTNLKQLSEVLEKIRCFLPDAKLIMVVRNQPSLIVSRYSEYLITGGSLDFESFADALMGKSREDNLFYQNYYFEISRMLERHFPRRQLLVLLQEEMRENTARIADQVSNFIGLTTPLELRQGLRSERRSLSLYGLTLLARINRLLVRRLTFGGSVPMARIPSFAYTSIVKVVRALDYYLLSRMSPGSSAVLSPARAETIRSTFRADNLKFQEYLGRDLVKHGYITTTKP